MYEFYLWLMVSDLREHHWEPIDLDDDEFEKERALRANEFTRLREKIKQACEVSGVAFDALVLHQTDGGVIVIGGFTRNHAYVGGVERHFLEALASSAPTTYGVLYTLDTEHLDPPRGEFSVFKLANQTVVESSELLVRDVGPRNDPS
jgi:hypothetical protein